VIPPVFEHVYLRALGCPVQALMKNVDLDLIQLDCDEASDYDTVGVFNAAVNASKASVINAASTVMERLRAMSYTLRR
jgi:hypothetical protein